MMNHPTTVPKNMDDETDRKRSAQDARGAVQIMDESKDLYERKNADYGDSWKLTGKTLALWLQHQGVDELTIEANEYELNALGLFTRRLDKMIREFNGWFVADELQVPESIVETHQDDVPYAAMNTQLAEEYAYADADDLLP